jgi:hypothetical protein
MEVLKMKRMELKIALTSVIVFIVGVIIRGIYSVIFKQSAFITIEVIENSGFDVIAYLLLIWIGIWLLTRRYKLLTWLLVLSIFFIGICDSISSGNVSSQIETLGWYNIIIFPIKGVVFGIIAGYQVEKLLEEDNKNINIININLQDNKGYINPEELEITHD